MLKKSFSEFAMSRSSVTVFPSKVIYLMLFVVLCLFVNVLNTAHLSPGFPSFII